MVEMVETLLSTRAVIHLLRGDPRFMMSLTPAQRWMVGLLRYPAGVGVVTAGYASAAWVAAPRQPTSGDVTLTWSAAGPPTSYLKRFPVDTLKIDRSFVDGLGRDAQDTAIVRIVVALARTLGLSVTAEGIETTQQQLELRDLGCDRGQGYLFARPLPVEGMDALLANGRLRDAA
jgi:hypothetical protein